MPLGSATATDGTSCFGILVAGVPVGDARFVDTCIDKEAQETMSKITTVTDKLRDLHNQSLLVVTQRCLCPMFHYWLQHCYPDDARHHAVRVDTAIESAGSACLGRAVLQDEISAERLRLLARMYGGGLRRAADLVPAAFVGTVQGRASFP